MPCGPRLSPTSGCAARTARTTSVSMSRLVSGLEREGLVRRHPDVNDAQAIRIESTAKARRILERGRASRLDLLESLLVEATDEEIDALRVAGEAVERALHA